MQRGGDHSIVILLLIIYFVLIKTFNLIQFNKNDHIPTGHKNTKHDDRPTVTVTHTVYSPQQS